MNKGGRTMNPEALSHPPIEAGATTSPARHAVSEALATEHTPAPSVASEKGRDDNLNEMTAEHPSTAAYGPPPPADAAEEPVTGLLVSQTPASLAKLVDATAQPAHSPMPTTASPRPLNATLPVIPPDNLSVSVQSAGDPPASTSSPVPPLVPVGRPHGGATSPMLGRSMSGPGGPSFSATTARNIPGPSELAASIGTLRQIPPWHGYTARAVTPTHISSLQVPSGSRDGRAPSAPPPPTASASADTSASAPVLGPTLPAFHRTSLSPEVQRHRWAGSGSVHPTTNLQTNQADPSRAPSQSPVPPSFGVVTSTPAPGSRPNSAMGTLQNFHAQGQIHAQGGVMPHGSQMGAGTPTNAAGRTLNVKDALTYLDQVKIKFELSPQVYNQFLDVMKEFKTQSIDTPGVINRVSTLFRGHPTLIQGFNTFLPPGYRIECSFIKGLLDTLPHGSTNHKGLGYADVITVHSPGGGPAESQVFVRGGAAPFNLTDGGDLPPGWQPFPEGFSDPGLGIEQPISPPMAQPAQAVPSPVPYMGLSVPMPHHHSMVSSSIPTPAITPGAQHVLQMGLAGASGGSTGGQGNGAVTPGGTARQPLEFNHAITYVNRIKSRFVDSPEIYKEFLDILQRYQKDARPIQDVYAQVTQLFKDAPDLLDEFKAFLPDPNAPQTPAGPLATSSSGYLGGGLVGNLQAGYFGPPPGMAASAVGPQLAHAAAAVAAASPVPSPVPPNASVSSGVKRPASTQRDSGRQGLQSVGTGERDPDVPTAAKRKRLPAGSSAPSIQAGGSRDAHVANATVQGSAPAPSPLELVANRPGKGKRGKQQARGATRDPSPDIPLATYEPQQIPVNEQMGDTAMVPMGGPGPSAPPYGSIPAYVDLHGAMQGRTLVNPRELCFFENAKKYLSGEGDKQKDRYKEFLRVLNLFSENIIDMKTLMAEACNFLGDDEALFEDFKGLVGYDVRKHGLVEGEVWEIKNVPLKERAKVDPSAIPGGYGPSYKRLPQAEVDLACSGRDEHCWSVLNDYYFGAAAYGTESEGPAHRKSVYEEAMEASEQERGHYSYWLDAVSRTIAHLESVQARIDSMDDNERPLFRLGYNLSGPSPSIYSRVLKKVYDSKYRDIMPLLEEQSATTVPVVLRRLRDTEQIWKSAEMQWNVVWREVERKNHYRALDHQVIPFKSSDKVYLKTANLVKELQEYKASGRQKRVVAHPEVGSARPTHHLEVGFEDEELFFESLYLISIFLDRTSFAKAERRRVYDATRTLLPTMFGLSRTETESFVPVAYLDESESEADPDDEESDAQTSAAGESKAAVSKNGSDDLHKRLLSAKPAEDEGGSSKAASPALSSPAAEVPADGDADGHGSGVNGEAEGSETHTREAVELAMDGAASALLAHISSSESEVDGRPAADKVVDVEGAVAHREWTPVQAERRFQCFGTSAFFAVFRLLHILYSRLSHLKGVAEKLKERQNPPWHRVNPLAIELGMAYVIHGVDDQPRPADHIFPFIIDQLHRYCDHELEQAVIEEELRILFPRDGYLLSTFDKVLQNALKALGTIMAEPKSKELLMLFKEAGHTPAEQAEYVAKVEAAVEGNDLFRMEWLPEQRRMTFSLVSADDHSPVEAADAGGAEAAMRDAVAAGAATDGRLEAPNRWGGKHR